LNIIRKEIPVGYNKHRVGNDDQMPMVGAGLPIVTREYANASKSLGTLGGGNHFIEIQQDVDSDDIYIMLHSGSRNLGKQVAEYYNKEAIVANESYYVDVPKGWGLAFLPLDSTVGQQYMREMKYCIAFAKASRRIMLRKIIHIFYAMLDLKEDHDEPIDCCHNFAQYEHHFGEDVMVHRKGATMARSGTIALIPGSQGSFSFIVQGRGNEDSFHSCSHGAGRKMGRKDAKKRLNLQTEVAHLDDMGVIHSIRGEKQLDEATGAYKDILQVMNNQQDLVRGLHQLKPLAVIKG
jgi:tRNA-splicing ligase RtcB